MLLVEDGGRLAPSLVRRHRLHDVFVGYHMVPTLGFNMTPGVCSGELDSVPGELYTSLL